MDCCDCMIWAVFGDDRCSPHWDTPRLETPYFQTRSDISGFGGEQHHQRSTRGERVSSVITMP